MLSTPARAQLLPDVFPPAVPGYGTDPGVAVQTRARPAFDSLGTRLGGVIVRPQIEESLGLDSNVLGQPSGKGSWLVRTSPSILVESTNPRDPAGLYVRLDDTRYPNLAGQNQTNWTVGGGTTLAVGQDHLTLGAAHLSLHQAQGDLDALPTDQPIAYQVNELRAAYATSLERFAIEPSFDVASWRFGAASILGAPASQTYRDRNVAQEGITFRYDVAPRRSIVLAVRGAEQAYIAMTQGAAAPDSTSLSMLAGIDDATDGLWHYRLLAGYEHRAFASPVYHAHGAVVAEADAIFTPGGMTTVTATLARGMEDAAQEGVAGFVYTGAKLTIDYEWRRDVLLQASTGVQRADLLGGGGDQTAVRFGVGATWLVNRRVRVIATYDAADTRGTGAPTTGLAGSFTRSIGLLTVRLAL
ncbi:MAG: outer membrane beta-barrel protein [Acetobacteraceae bacterium]